MKFCFEKIILAPRDELFAFYEEPEHLSLLHRGWSAFRLIHHDGNIKVGSTLWFEVTIARIVPVVLGFRQTVYDPPQRFGEQLVHGPFRRFVHIHDFIEVESGTLVRDALDIELPLHYGGELMMKSVVAPALKRTFAFRADALERLVRTRAVVDRQKDPPD
jgi:ligand-binding SRPBCC domain-containing protein